jgi:ribulose-phosphate 3-epimerase
LIPFRSNEDRFTSSVPDGRRLRSLALPLIPDLSAIKLGPSLLSADFLRLGAQLQEMESAHADFVHFDVMDGQFVPNISIGLPVLEATRAGTSLPIDVHLMMVQPDRWVESFVEAGADVVTFHIEATPHAHRVAQSIERAGGRPGVALNPSTPLDTIAELLPFVRQVLIMTVNPGFGGQAFIPEMIGKVERLADLIDRHHLDCLIQVDGGINEDTIAEVVTAGARSIVAGSAVINAFDTIAGNLDALRLAITGRAT